MCSKVVLLAVLIILWCAGPSSAGKAFPANVFSMTLSERMKLSKGLRRIPPAAYTMSGAP